MGYDLGGGWIGRVGLGAFKDKVGLGAFKGKVTGAFKDKVTGAFKDKVGLGAFRHIVVFDFLCL